MACQTESLFSVLSLTYLVALGTVVHLRWTIRVLKAMWPLMWRAK